jgi:predicted metal-dependent enzyme (double-stranded beta helix superfamily)
MSVPPNTGAPERPSDLPPNPTLSEACSYLARLAGEREFLDSRILPLYGAADRAGDWYVACRHDAPDGTSLQVFVWPPGSKTRIHDHSSWGAFRCLVGTLLEERYERLDDGSKEDHARLRKMWERGWRKGDGISTVLPYEGGIHRVGNPGDSIAISVHLYGPRLGEIDGRDYDPARSYVCDRH